MHTKWSGSYAAVSGLHWAKHHVGQQEPHSQLVPSCKIQPVLALLRVYWPPVAEKNVEVIKIVALELTQVVCQCDELLNRDLPTLLKEALCPLPECLACRHVLYVNDVNLLVPVLQGSIWSP